MMMRQREKDAYELFQEAKANMPGFIKRQFFPPITLTRSKQINVIIDARRIDQIFKRLDWLRFSPSSISDDSSPTLKWKNAILNKKRFSDPNSFGNTDDDHPFRQFFRLVKKLYKDVFKPPYLKPRNQDLNVDVTTKLDAAYRQLMHDIVLNNPDSFVNLDSFLYLLSILDSKNFSPNIKFPAFNDLSTFEKLETIKLYYSLSAREISVLDPKPIYEAPNSFYEAFITHQFSNFFRKPNHGNNFSERDYFEERDSSFSFSEKKYYEAISKANFKDASIYNRDPYFSPNNIFKNDNLGLSQTSKLMVQPRSSLLPPRPVNIFHYSWNMDTCRFDDLRIHNPINKKTKVVTDLDSIIRFSPLLELDDLDKLFFSNYKKFLRNNFEELQKFETLNRLDSSHFITSTAEYWYKKEHKIIQQFSDVHLNFLPRIIKSSSDDSASKKYYMELFLKMNLERINNLETSDIFVKNNLSIRRSINPSESISFNPSFRTLFHPRKIYTPFVSKVPKRSKYKKIKGTFARPDGSISNNSQEIYFFKFNPSNSFHSEYSEKILKQIDNSVESISLSQHIRRHIPFRRKHFRPTKFSDESPIFRFNPLVKKFLKKKYERRTGKRTIKNFFGHDKVTFSEDIRDLPKIPRYGFFLWVEDISNYISTIFIAIVVKPISEIFFNGILKDSFFSWFVIALVFFFYDYVFVVIQVYFPALWSLFDYNFLVFKSFSFYNFLNFLVFIFLIISFFYVFSSFYPKPSPLYASSPLVLGFFFLCFSLFTFASFFSIFYISALLKIFGIFFVVALFFIKICQPFFSSSFFFSHELFFPFPTKTQMFGYYIKNFFFSSWPKRFNFPIIFTHNFFQTIRTVKSFFFHKNFLPKKKFLLSRRFIQNPELLQSPPPFFGPNAFFDSSYKRDKYDHIVPPPPPSIGLETTVIEEYFQNKTQSTQFLDPTDLTVTEPLTHLHHDNRSRNSSLDDLELPYLTYQDHQEISPINVETSSLASTGYWSQMYVLNSSKKFIPYYPFSQLRSSYQDIFRTNTLGAFLASTFPKETFSHIIIPKFKNATIAFSAKFSSAQSFIFFVLDIFFFFVRFPISAIRFKFEVRFVWIIKFFFFIILLILFGPNLSRRKNLISLYFIFLKIVRSDTKSISIFAFFFYLFNFFFLSTLVFFMRLFYPPFVDTQKLFIQSFFVRVRETSHSMLFFNIFGFFKF